MDELERLLSLVRLARESCCKHSGAFHHVTALAQAVIRERFDIPKEDVDAVSVLVDVAIENKDRPCFVNAQKYIKARTRIGKREAAKLCCDSCLAALLSVSSLEMKALLDVVVPELSAQSRES
jgi:hypothetical protein